MGGWVDQCVGGWMGGSVGGWVGGGSARLSASGESPQSPQFDVRTEIIQQVCQTLGSRVRAKTSSGVGGERS